jgi:hypothetical protein
MDTNNDKGNLPRFRGELDGALTDLMQYLRRHPLLGIAVFLLLSVLALVVGLPMGAAKLEQVLGIPPTPTSSPPTPTSSPPTPTSSPPTPTSSPPAPTSSPPTPTSSPPAPTAPTSVPPIVPSSPRAAMAYPEPSQLDGVTRAQLIQDVECSQQGVSASFDVWALGRYAADSKVFLRLGQLLLTPCQGTLTFPEVGLYDVGLYTIPKAVSRSWIELGKEGSLPALPTDDLSSLGLFSISGTHRFHVDTFMK